MIIRRLRRACVVRDRESAANIVLRVLKQLLSKYLQDSRGELADDMESYLSSELIRKAQRAAIEVCQRHPIIVAIDSLEHYAITDDATMRAAAALVECASKFNRDYSRQGIHVKVFLTAEAYPQLAESVTQQSPEVHPRSALPALASEGSHSPGVLEAVPRSE